MENTFCSKKQLKHSSYLLPLFLFSLVLVFAACAHKPSPEEAKLEEAAQNIVETDQKRMQDCQYLGSVTVTGKVNPMFSQRGMRKTKEQVRRKAVLLEATHLVWLYTYDTTAAALVYSCPGK